MAKWILDETRDAFSFELLINRPLNVIHANGTIREARRHRGLNDFDKWPATIRAR